MDEQSRLRQFNLRTLLAVGMLWGGYLLVQLLVFALSHGSTASFLTRFAFVVNCLTIAPASLLAFWRRRLACLWLVCDALLITCAAVIYTLRTHQLGPDLIIGAVSSIAMGAALVMIEARGWPPALAQDGH